MSQLVEQALCREATPRCGHVAVNYGPYIIVWGGYMEEHYLPADEVYVFSTEFRVWYCLKQDIHKCPWEVSGASACCHGDDLYVFGGHCYNGNINDLNRLDLKTYTWSSLTPTVSPSPRDKALSWFFDKKFYCFGGFGPSIKGFLVNNGIYIEDTESSLWPRRGWNNQLVMYDTETEEWTNPCCKGDVPLPRAASAAARLESLVYIFGGRHKSSRINDLHSLDLQTLKWSGELRTSGCTPCGRSWHSLTAVSDSRLFLYGGFSQNNEPLSDGWILDTRTLTWCQLDYLPSNQPRLWHTANFSSEGDIIIFGGCSNNILDTSEANKMPSEVLTIQLKPYSLLRICLDDIYKRKSETMNYWTDIPQSLCQWLQKKHKLEEKCSLSDIVNDSEEEINEQGLSCSIS